MLGTPPGAPLAGRSRQDPGRRCRFGTAAAAPKVGPEVDGGMAAIYKESNVPEGVP